MNTPYKPETYNTVSPYLTVNGVADTIEFLVRVFDAVELRRIPHEPGRSPSTDGKVAHAEVRIDDSVVMLTDSIPEWPSNPSHVHVYVTDVDATYAKAIAAGAESIQDPLQRPGEEDKRGGFKDSGGTSWWVATKVS